MASDCIKDDNQVGSTVCHFFSLMTFAETYIQSNKAHPQHWTQLLAKMADSCRCAYVLCRSPSLWLLSLWSIRKCRPTKITVTCHMSPVGYFIPRYQYFRYFSSLPGFVLAYTITCKNQSYQHLGCVGHTSELKKNGNSSPTLQDQTTGNRFSFLLDQDIPTKTFFQCTS